MSLRLKLLLAQAPLAAALAVVGFVGVTTMSSLGRYSEAILTENYRSVLAAQRMKEAVERMEDSAALALLDPQRAGDASAYRQRFEAELQVEESNITEVGEGNAARRLRDLWTAYQERFDTLSALRDRDAARTYFFAELEPTFAAVREAADAILAMNQDAMVRKSERAQREAARMNAVMLLAALAALLIGGLLSMATTTRLLQPLGLLTQTVRRIGEGEFDARTNIPGRDELAQLASNINAMGARLSQYRRSSLGELLLAQQASQAAIDSMPDPVVVFDVGGGLLNVNRAAETLLGLSIESTVIDALSSLEPSLRAVLERVRSHVLGGKGPYIPKGFEEAVRVAAPDAEHFFLPRATPVYSEAGSIAGASVVLQDVTRLRRVDELRNDLVATVAHEFRTPLTSLRMAIHMCLEQTAGPVTDKQGDLLYAARDDCERLQAIVDELLDLARIQGGRIGLNRQLIAPAALVEAAVDAIRSAAEERQVVVRTTLLPGLPDLLADRERLQLVLSNLLTNALRHSSKGGTVQVRARQADDGVRFEVTDTGPGIAHEYQRSVFEKFFRVPGAPSGGAGLGLSISKDIVEAHGGEIGLQSEPAAGCTFWFTVPAGTAIVDNSQAL